jgi:hypothetical protein
MLSAAHITYPDVLAAAPKKPFICFAQTINLAQELFWFKHVQNDCLTTGTLI